MDDKKIEYWCKRILQESGYYDDDWEIRKIKPSIKKFYEVCCEKKTQ